MYHPTNAALTLYSRIRSIGCCIWLPRFWQDRRASTSLEFAIIAIPFIFWIVGLIVLGLQFALAVWLDKAVGSTGRYLSIHYQQRTSAFVTADICAKMNAFVSSADCATSLQVYAQAVQSPDGTNGFGALTPAKLTGSTLSPTTFDAGGTDEVLGAKKYVLLQVAFKSPFTMPGGFIPNLTMLTSVPYQNN